MTFRIFTNDRGTKNGVYMYSAFNRVTADTAEAAEELAERQFGPFAYRGKHGPIKAIEEPLEQASEESKRWLRRHVGDRHKP